MLVEPLIKIYGISVASDDKIRLSTLMPHDNPQQLKLDRYNPKIVITRKPEHGTIKKIYRNSGDLENIKDKEIRSFTYKELKGGLIYFNARKLPDDVEVISDSFEYTLIVKSYQPGQAFVSIEIYKVKPKIIAGEESSVDVASTSSSLPINYLFIIATLLGMFILVLILIILIRCHTQSKTDKNNLDKDFPPSLPRPPDFISVNNNRLYSGSDGEESIPVTASSTPLPILSSIPHCKVIPIGSIEDSESDEMIDLNQIDGLPQPIAYYPYGGGDENDEWSSSCDVANDVNYSSIINRNPHQNNNPLLRRNQYWV